MLVKCLTIFALQLISLRNSCYEVLVTFSVSYGKTCATKSITWQELFCGKKLTLVQLSTIRHITAHSTRDLVSITGPITVSSTSCQPLLYILVVESHVNIGRNRGSKRRSVDMGSTRMDKMWEMRFIFICHFIFEMKMYHINIILYFIMHKSDPILHFSIHMINDYRYQ